VSQAQLARGKQNEKYAGYTVHLVNEGASILS
jgi:hypothetical protein